MEEHNCTNSTSINVSVEVYLKELSQQVEQVMMPGAVLLALLAVMGLVGNSLILVVFVRGWSPHPTKVFMVAIAGFDLAANLTAFPSEINTMMSYWTFNNPYLCKVQVVANVVSTGAGAITLLAVAVVRYRKICRPHGWQVTKRQAEVVTVLIVCVTAACSIPYGVMFGRASIPTSPCYKIMGYECYVDDSFRHTIWPLVTNALFVLIYILLAVPLAVLYILVGKTAKRHAAKKHECVQGIKRCGNSLISKTATLNEKDGVLLKDSPTCGNIKDVRFQIDEDSTVTERVLTPYETESSNGQSNTSASASTNSDQSNNCNIQVSDKEYLQQNYPYTKLVLQKSDVRMDEIASENVNRKEGPSIKQRYRANDRIDSTDNVQTTNAKRDTLQLNQSCIQVLSSKTPTNLNKSGVARKIMRGVSTNFHDNKSRNKTFQHANVYMVNKHRRGRISSQHVTNMLTTITALYIISYLPFLMLAMFKAEFPKTYAEMSLVELSLYQLFLRTYLLNSVMNPVIYSLCDSNFRQECLKLLKLRC